MKKPIIFAIIIFSLLIISLLVYRKNEKIKSEQWETENAAFIRSRDSLEVIKKADEEKNKLPTGFYKIISEKKHVDARYGFNKCNIEIELKDKITYNQLMYLANDLRENRKSYDKLWIFYNIKGKKQTVAWATTHFTPNLNIWINENY